MTEQAQTPPPASPTQPEPAAAPVQNAAMADVSAAAPQTPVATQAAAAPTTAPAAAPVDDDEVLIVDDEPAPAPAPAPAPVVQADLGKLTALTDKGDLASELTQVAAGVAQPVSSTTRYKKQKGNQLIRAVTPVLFTIGGMLLIPSMWSVMILSGAENIPGAHIDDVRTKAFLMLICWPVAILLIATGIYYVIQIMGEKDDAPAPRKRKVAVKK